MDNLQVRTTELLMKIGVDPGLLGYKYLRSAVEKVYYDENLIHTMTKGLYPAIAEEHNTTPSRVERSIRHAIERAFDRMTANDIKEYFGAIVQYSSRKVTNTTFIACLVERLRVEGTRGVQA